MYGRVCKIPETCGGIQLPNTILPDRRRRELRSELEAGFEWERRPTYSCQCQPRVNRANPKAGPTRWDHLHDNPRVELRIRGDLNSMFIYRVLDVKRGDRTSDRGEKHPDCKILSRANATKGREDRHTSDIVRP